MKKLTSFFSKFSRLSAFIVFTLFALAFATSSIAIAQGVDRQRCIDDAAYFNANRNACLVAVGYQYSGNPNLPPESKNQKDAVGQSYANNQITLETHVWNECVLVDGTPKCNGSVMGAFLGQLLNSLTSIPRSEGNTQTYVRPDGSKTTITYGTGAIGSLTNLTANMVGKPMISSTEYIADVVNTIKNPLGAQPAYAQGLGFSSLEPALALWKVFRNVAYFFFVIIFLVVGFLIMFRSKIGGQAAVTVQQALPKIVVSLLLVTFSYAIAGFMIDLMYLLIYLMIGIFSPFFSGAAGGSAFGGTSLVDIAFRNNIVQNTFALIGNGVVGNVSGAMGNIVIGALGLTEKDVIGAGLQGISNILFTLILAIVVLVSLFRVFLALLQAYIFIFFSVIFAPIQLLLGAIPGQNTFGKWIKGLLENLLVFPTIILLIFIAYFFSVGPYGVQNTNGQNQGKGFSAPQLSSNQGPDGFRVYQSLIALGAILAMPEVLKVTKGLMKGELGVTPQDLINNAKQGVPLGTRLGFAPALGAANAGLAFGRDFVDTARTGRFDLRGNWKKAKEGFQPGAARGIALSEQLSRGIKANQPDILNPVTGALDRRWNPKVAEDRVKRQEFEDNAEQILEELRRRKT